MCLSVELYCFIRVSHSVCVCVCFSHKLKYLHSWWGWLVVVGGTGGAAQSDTFNLTCLKLYSCVRSLKCALTNTPPSQTDARPFIFGIVSLHVSTVETQSEGGDSHQPDLWWHLFNQL